MWFSKLLTPTTSGLEPIHENWGINLGEEVDESGDPPRVWEQNMQRPGCAFTRSIGDHVAEKIGVFAEPEVRAAGGVGIL